MSASAQTTELPAKPSGLEVVIEPGSLAVSLDWDDVDGATGYRVRWRAQGAGNPLNEGDYVEASWETIAVEDVGDWVVRIEACNEAGCGRPLARHFTVEPAPEPSPDPTPLNQAPTVDGHAPHYATFVGSQHAPRGTLVSKPFGGIFSDPDGDELTYTVTVPADRDALVDTLMIDEDLQLVFFRADNQDDWDAVTPALDNPVRTTVTLTATDPDGLSASVTGVMGTKWEPQPALGLSLSGEHERIIAEWPRFDGAAKYQIQWRSSDQAYSSDRQQDIQSDSEAHSATIDGLNNNTSYGVRLAALDHNDQELAAEERSTQPVSAHDYIEDNFIDPYQSDHPWLAEAWYGVPVTVAVTHSGSASYNHFSRTISLSRADYQDRLAVIRVMAHHYIVHGRIHDDNPDAMLAILSLWLAETDHTRRLAPRTNVCRAAWGALADYTVKGAAATFRYPEAAALVASVSNEEIPQWFYDSYTADGTLDTVDHDALWADLAAAQGDRCLYYLVGQTQELFGGHCSNGEARQASWSAAYRNPWVDGGCVNRQPQGLSAATSGYGDLTVTWQAPRYATTPAIDAYVVQWKSGNENYDTARQAVVNDIDNLSHTITGLAAGADYTVRVAAVNQADTVDFTDDDGHDRTAETIARSAMGLSLSGDHKRIIVKWSDVEGAARYLVRWRSGDQNYDGEREQQEPGGSESYSVTIGGLDNATAYTVRVIAVDDQNYGMVRDEQSAQTVSARQYIEDNFIIPYQDDYPWLHEAWFDTPISDVHIGSGAGCWGTYNLSSLAITISDECRRGQHLLYHELAHHYTLHQHIHADDPEAMLSMLSMWLYLIKVRDAEDKPWNVMEVIAAYMGNHIVLDNPGYHSDIARDIVASASQQQIPQWFYDTYTADGTLQTVDLEKLWADFRATIRGGGGLVFMVGQTRGLFGGHCSIAEAARAQWSAAMHNPWVDGGCVNRRPQALSAAAGGAGELVVTWQAPLYATTPNVNAYVVQWKAEGEEYGAARQAVVTKRDNPSHIITGLDPGTEYTVRVAAVNRTDTADFTDDDDRDRTAQTAAASGAEAATPVGLSLAGKLGQIVAQWQPVAGAATYRVQWRTLDQSFSSDRQQDVGGGSASYSTTIGDLDNDTPYIVRVEALDDQGGEVATEQRSARPVSAHEYIEDNLIVPYMDDYPWLAEAWFAVPVTIVLKDSGWASYDHFSRTISLSRADYRDRLAVYRVLAYHYIVHGRIHDDNPDAMLAILSLWLAETDHTRRFEPGSSVCRAAWLALGDYTVYGAAAYFRFPEAAALVASVSSGEIPQWFYDSYTADGTLDTVDYEALWADLTAAQGDRCLYYLVGQTQGLFGGHCSNGEARQASWSRAMHNPWVAGGCVNRRPQALSATAGGAGELTVTWERPLWRIKPTIDAYVVQWKWGSQDYHTSRQVIITDLGSLSHTITGLAAGADYTVRVAAVNQNDTADFTDNDGRDRTAEATGTAG